MRCIADRFVVVLDANVLYPFRVRDALLRFAEAGLFRARWSPTILDEWRRNLIAQKPGYEASMDAQIAAMRIAFPEGCVTCQTAFKRDPRLEWAPWAGQGHAADLTMSREFCCSNCAGLT